MDDVIGVGKLIEAGTGVINNVVNKIASATGILYSDSDYKIRKESEKKYIDRIINDDSIDECVKLALVSNHKQVFRQYKNQMDIVGIALNKLTIEADHEKVDNDWLSYFFDKAKNISNDNIQLIWGNILANEFNEPGSVSKSLLNILSIIDSKKAEKFNLLCSISVLNGNRLDPFIVDMNGSYEMIKKQGLDKMDLLELDKLDLINFNEMGFSYKGYDIFLGYKDELYEIKRNPKGRLILFENSIYKGCVSLTEDGRVLCDTLCIEQSEIVPELIRLAYQDTEEYEVYRYIEKSA